MAPFRIAAVFVALVLSQACAREPRDAEHGHGVLVIAIDGLRVDHLSFAGYDRDTSAQGLDSLAKQGLVFSDAYSTAPELVPAHAALLTGCDPNVARRVLPPEVAPNPLTTWHIPEQAPSLAREFLRHGWATACFADDPNLSPAFGFAQGFADFMACEIDERTRPRDIGIDGVGTHFEQWLRNRKRSDNWFAYLELHDLERTWSLDLADHGSLPADERHWYTDYPPREGSTTLPPVSIADPAFFALSRSKWSRNARTMGELESTYDGAIRRLDQALFRLFDRMRSTGRFENATICIVGTYGMGFGESGLYLDSGTLSDCDLHVPWILLTPTARGVTLRRYDGLVSTLDLAPTLLALEGLDVPDSMQGESLAPLLQGVAQVPRANAFASSGLFEGWVVIDASRCLERTWPGRSDVGDLVRQWFGDDLDHRDEVREVLHERKAVADRGHLRHVSLDPRGRAELAELGEAWFTRIERVRRQWQATHWLGGDESNSTKSEGGDQ